MSLDQKDCLVITSIGADIMLCNPILSTQNAMVCTDALQSLTPIVPLEVFPTLYPSSGRSNLHLDFHPDISSTQAIVHGSQLWSKTLANGSLPSLC